MFEVLENQSVLSVSGLDSKKFLQSLTTNDIIQNTYSHNYLLNNQGRYLFDFFVHTNKDNTFFIEINKSRTEDLVKCFNLYKLRSDVATIDLSATHQVIYSRDPLQIDFIKSNQDPRYKKLGARSIVKSENINSSRKLFKDLYLIDKYKYSIPDGDSDLIFEKSIPIEYGAEDLGSICYNKGCYIGQEVISRAKYQGIVRKKIYSISSRDDDIINQGRSEVFDLQGNKIGVLCSTYKNQGITLLREELFLKLVEKVAIINGLIVDIKVPNWRKY